MSKNILITGGSGFLASYIFKLLEKKKIKTTIFDIKKPTYRITKNNFIKASITNKNKLLKATKGIDTVLHFASIADIEEANKHPLKTINTNLFSTINLIEACITNKVKMIIFASSIYALSEQGGFYSSTKFSSEIFLKRYSKKYGFKYNILRFGSVFGENSNKFNPINQLINQYKSKRQIVKKTDGNEIRNYIHAKDAAKVCYEIMINKKHANKTFNIIGSKKYKVKNLLNDVSKKLNINVIFSKKKITRDDHYKINPYSLKIERGKIIKPKNSINIKNWLISNLS